MTNSNNHIRLAEIIEIIGMQFFHALVIGIWFHSFGVFRCLHGYTRKESLLLLIALIVCSIVLETIVEVSKFYNSKTAGWIDDYCGAAGGYGIYMILSYYSVMKAAVISIIIIALVASAVYSSLLFFRKYRTRRNVKSIILRRVNRAIQGFKTINIAILTLVAVSMGLLNLFGFGILRPTAASVVKNNNDDWTIANNIETVINLRYDNWILLSPEEKLNVLQVVANIEAHYLGLPHELNVCASNLKEYTLASYNDNDHLITLSIESLNTDVPQELLDSILHEAYHAYQYRLIDVYLNVEDESLRSLQLFNDTEVYINEFADYSDGENEDELDDYFTQRCELDACEYATRGVQEYYARIDEYYALNNRES